MRKISAVVIVGATLSCQADHTPSTPSSTVALMSATLKSGDPEGSAAALRAANERIVKEVLRAIAGDEGEPAGQVFSDVRYLKDVPVLTFFEIMSAGYANALGVGCAHCHDLSDFASDAKRPKRAAREMQAMHKGINTQLIAMQNLETLPPASRTINCATCHQGRINPNLP